MSEVAVVQAHRNWRTGAADELWIRQLDKGKLAQQREVAAVSEQRGKDARRRQVLGQPGDQL